MSGKKKDKPKRGDIWWVAYNTSSGSEITKNRPSVVISNNLSNTHLSCFQVIPITSNIKRVYPGETLIQVGKKKGKAKANQITTVTKERVKNFESQLTSGELREVEDALKTQLGLI